MTENEIRKCINDGAITLFSFLGHGKHMERIDYKRYSLIRPKAGEQGTHTIFNIQLEDLSDSEALETIQKIRQLKLHTWWSTDCSDRIFRLLWGKDRLPPTLRKEDTEYSMALLPSDKTVLGKVTKDITINKVDNLQLFKLWANIANYIYEDGYPVVHADNHYHLCENGSMDCYIGFYKGVPASIISVLYHDGIAALYFLGTLEGFRKKGLATALSAYAINKAFEKDAKIAVAIVWPTAKHLADSLGFRAY